MMLMHDNDDDAAAKLAWLSSYLSTYLRTYLIYSMPSSYHTVGAKDVLKGKNRSDEAMQILTRIAKQVGMYVRMYVWM